VKLIDNFMFGIFCFAFVTFFFGFFGVLLLRNHVFIIIIALELMFLGTSLNFLFSSYIFDDILGVVFALVIFVVAAIESVIGLSILVVYYRVFGTVSVDFAVMLKS
jgi:NADH:ubiquinone oxidoreductase subunit K